MTNYFLDFIIHSDRDPGLDQGLLLLRKVEGKEAQTVEIWTTTSSVANKQYVGSFNHRGGIIPPEYHTKTLQNSDGSHDAYTVNLNPEDSSHVKGVEGSFYRISPNEITTKKGGERSYFGIHLDANVPGSMGCPVMNQYNFDCFENTMAGLVRKGINKLPLFVTIT